MLNKGLFIPVIFALLASMFSGITSSKVDALTAEQRGLYQAGINWYDPNGGFCGSGLTSIGTLPPGKIYILGDSITDGAESFLRERFVGDWDVGTKDTATDRINGEVNRSVNQAVTEINNDSSLVADSVAIVVALGTNDGGSNFSSKITETTSAIRSYNPNAPIFWVDIAVTTYDSSPGNSGIHDQASSGDYEVISWFDAVFPGLDPTTSNALVDSYGYLEDGVHPNENGYNVYSQLVYDSVSKHQIITGGTAAGSVSVSGSNNAEKAYNYFRSKGLSAIQSAAVLGNFYVESGLDPARKQGSGHQTFSSITEVANSNGTLGYGLAQWTHDSRQNNWVDYTREKGWDIVQLESQLEWSWHEWTTGGSGYGYDEFLKTTDLRQATWIFVSFYERPGSVTGHTGTTTQPTSGSALDSLNARDDYAKEFLAQFGGNAVSSLGALGQCVTGEFSTDFSASGVRSDGSPPWIGNPGNCELTFTEGAVVLQQYVLDVWQPPVTSVGGYNCRAAVGFGDITSIHGMGRALDIMISALNPADLAIGNQIRNWMIANSVEVGVQKVIWNRHIWKSDTDGWNDYCRGECTDEGGSRHPHENHLHIEINEDGGNKILSWYVGR